MQKIQGFWGKGHDASWRVDRGEIEDWLKRIFADIEHKTSQTMIGVQAFDKDFQTLAVVVWTKKDEPACINEILSHAPEIEAVVLYLQPPPCSTEQMIAGIVTT